jgi:hypothetical protein
MALLSDTMNAQRCTTRAIMVTDALLPDAMEPAVLLEGTPAQADFFLLSTLWGPEGTCIPAFQVLGWMENLRVR